ncbi:DUF4375 domain-containing protein [Myxococcus llanfairpwllgwyngyllgogerychwyrndrobwllllantysiliogogogochensis]|uniref:DUF4375 domain-containing protein n=1 Tax=Myxococcus llanfairpwllgwyngyllgogerychwyrndrobwllllantysiliogogogochensis TaxID=2590453 RepID=A0A540WLL7_9BACT|nr:DUF4375 domain-containing protein [Myxococcus llanfairpwllgwyngyllgogerychwyrndrobwllllantysiliogogogochensis]TQF09916.1 DUF4375 domain-containing protein [Myxococcus llanfairpwllgwyngyllgogerychwyrndrobwllllantysiliogogogochensis]
MSGEELNDEVTKLIAERLRRVADVLPPEGHAYHVVEAQTAAGERAGGLWMVGPEGGIPVFQSRELATEALQFVPPPQALGYLDESAVGWGVHALSADEFRTLFINPTVMLYVVLKVSDSGIEAQPLTEPREMTPPALTSGEHGPHVAMSGLEAAPAQVGEGGVMNAETRLARASVEELSPGERLWRLMEPAFDHDAKAGTHGQRVLALTTFFVRDVENGGLDQALFNFTPTAVDFVLKGFDEIGADEHAATVRAGMLALFGATPPETQNERRRIIDTRPRAWLDKHIDPLSERLMGEERLQSCFLRYVDAHPSEFFVD